MTHFFLALLFLGQVNKPATSKASPTCNPDFYYNGPNSCFVTLPHAAPPDFTPQSCDITSLGGDCGYLFPKEPLESGTDCNIFDTKCLVADLLYYPGQRVVIDVPCPKGSVTEMEDEQDGQKLYLCHNTESLPCVGMKAHSILDCYGRGIHQTPPAPLPYPAPPVPLAKSLAQNGWACEVTETNIHCTKGNK